MLSILFVYRRLDLKYGTQMLKKKIRLMSMQVIVLSVIKSPFKL